jgi:hypothetical protein
MSGSLIYPSNCRLPCRLICLGILAAFALMFGGSAVAQSIELDRPMGESLARAMLGRFGYGPTTDSSAP